MLCSFKPGAVGEAFTNTLAKFLVGAGPGHYFGVSVVFPSIWSPFE